MSTYLQLALLFGSLSLMSIGGGNVVLPEMHERAVHDHHWVTSAQFANLFSIAQAAPGPSILLVTLVGYGAGLKAGGVPGAVAGGLIAAMAMVVPAAGVMYAVTQFWERAKESRWRIAVEKGLPPMTVGLILATALVMSRAADHDWRAYLLTGVATLLFVFTKINPLWVVGVAGVIGYLGLV